MRKFLPRHIFLAPLSAWAIFPRRRSALGNAVRSFLPCDPKKLPIWRRPSGVRFVTASMGQKVSAHAIASQCKQDKLKKSHARRASARQAMPKRGDAIFVAELLPTLKSWHELFQPHFVSFFDAKTRAREKKKRKGCHSGPAHGFVDVNWGF